LGEGRVEIQQVYMDIKTFWELIDKTSRASKEALDADEFIIDEVDDMQIDLLVKSLSALSEEDIFAWERIFDDLMDEAYIAELWEVAYIINCGCGDDGFTDFRAWVISQGEDVYRNAITDPESLVNVINVKKNEQAFSGLWSVVISAYESKTGKEFDTLPVKNRERPQLKGVRTQAESETEWENMIIKRYPKIAAKFWKRCSDPNGFWM
jgi:hypothetical protein